MSALLFYYNGILLWLYLSSQIFNFNRINRIDRILQFTLLSSLSALQERPALVIKPERIRKYLTHLSHAFLRCLSLQSPSCLNRYLFTDQFNQFRLTCHPLRKNRVCFTDTWEQH